MRQAMGGVARLLAGVLALAAPAAAGEVRRVESVGSVALIERASTGAPRDAAVRAAVQAAVFRVGRAMLPVDFVPPMPLPGVDEEPPESGEPLDPDTWLALELGDEPFEYATRFRVVEDRGVRPAMFSQNPDVENEYVVVAEVHVDVSRIRERLAASGAVAPPSRAGDRRLRIVLEGLESYEPLAALRSALLDDPGVHSVLPLEFSPNRAILVVDADRGAEAVIGDLHRRVPEALQFVPIELGADEATLLVDWNLPSPELPPDAPGLAAPTD